MELNENNITDSSSITILNFLEKNKKLKNLNLAGNKMGGLGDFFPVEKNFSCHLKKLNISGNKMGGKIKNIFHCLEFNQSLLNLKLSNNHLTEEDLIFISKFFAENKNVKIKKLDLSFNHFGEEKNLHFCEMIKKNKSLNKLNLAGNDVSHFNSLKLCESLKFNKNLNNLNLSFNHFNDSSISLFSLFLIDNVTLLSLHFRENQTALSPSVLDFIEDSLLRNKSLRDSFLSILLFHKYTSSPFSLFSSPLLFYFFSFLKFPPHFKKKRKRTPNHN